MELQKQGLEMGLGMVSGGPSNASMHELLKTFQVGSSSMNIGPFGSLAKRPQTSALQTTKVGQGGGPQTMG